MNCHVCLTDTYNEISVGMFQRGNIGNERRANPLTQFYATRFILYVASSETLLSPRSVMNCLTALSFFSSRAAPLPMVLHSKGPYTPNSEAVCKGLWCDVELCCLLCSRCCPFAGSHDWQPQLSPAV